MHVKMLMTRITQFDVSLLMIGLISYQHYFSRVCIILDLMLPFNNSNSSFSNYFPSLCKILLFFSLFFGGWGVFFYMLRDGKGWLAMS